jgi:hypothetical protein
VSVIVPSDRGAATLQVNAPAVQATSAQTTVPSASCTPTAASDSQVPAIDGRRSVALVPSTGEVIAGGPGAMVSTPKFRSTDGEPRLPAGSDGTATIRCAPSLSEFEVQLNAPATHAAVQLTCAPSRIVTVDGSSHVPLTTGVRSSSRLPSVGTVMVTPAGGAVSIVNVRLADGGLVLPARSICVAAMVWRPSPSGADEQTNNEAEQIVVQSGIDPSLTVTVAPVSQLPFNAGVASAISAPEAGATMFGAAGAMASTVNVRDGDGGPRLSAASSWLAVSVCTPEFNTLDVQV